MKQSQISGEGHWIGIGDLDPSQDSLPGSGQSCPISMHPRGSTVKPPSQANQRHPVSVLHSSTLPPQGSTGKFTRNFLNCFLFCFMKYFSKCLHIALLRNGGRKIAIKVLSSDLFRPLSCSILHKKSVHVLDVGGSTW